MSDPVGDIILGGLDAVLPLDKAQKSLIDRVDEIISDSVSKGNPDIAGNALNYLMGMSRISGLSLAKMIYTFKFQWENFDRRETFEQYLNDYSGIQKVTIKRYYKVWEMLVSGDVPRESTEKLKLLPIRCLVPIANMWSQGWPIDDSQWQRLSNAPDPSTVNKIIREIKDDKPKKGSLQIEWESEEKKLTMWKDGVPHNVYLQFDEDDPIVISGLERLFGDGRVLEK